MFFGLFGGASYLSLHTFGIDNLSFTQTKMLQSTFMLMQLSVEDFRNADTLLKNFYK